MKRIKIVGYKSIKEIDLELRPINILIGANGGGKSNFLSFFDFLKHMYNGNLQEFVALKGIETFLHQGSEITTEIKAKLTFKNTNAYSFTIKKGENGFVFTHEGLWYRNNISAPDVIDISSFKSESLLRHETLSRADYIKGYIQNLKKYHFHDTGENSPFSKVTNSENDKYFVYEDGRNLAPFLKGISKKNPEVYKLILKTIQSIAPYFLDFYFPQEDNENIKLLWQSKYSSSVYGVNDLSDGTIRFIALTTLFLQPRLPETIIIDEPELGLHPTALYKLSGLIKLAAAKGCQVIIATQSTDLINHFEPEDILTVDQINGESSFTRLNSEELYIWLEDYTLGDLWKRNIISAGHPNN